MGDVVTACSADRGSALAPKCKVPPNPAFRSGEKASHGEGAHQGRVDSAANVTAVTIGNSIGSAVLVAGAYWLLYRRLAAENI
jgi:hypothetical protein